MKIQGNDPIARIEEILGSKATGQARPARTDAPKAPGDRVELSAAAQEFYRVREAALREPEVREALVEEVRRQVESGQYQHDHRAVARKVLEDLSEFPTN